MDPKNVFSQKSPWIFNFWNQFLNPHIKPFFLAGTITSGHKFCPTVPIRAMWPASWERLNEVRLGLFLKDKDLWCSNAIDLLQVRKIEWWFRPGPSNVQEFVDFKCHWPSSERLNWAKAVLFIECNDSKANVQRPSPEFALDAFDLPLRSGRKMTWVKERNEWSRLWEK